MWYRVQAPGPQQKTARLRGGSRAVSCSNVVGLQPRCACGVDAPLSVGRVGARLAVLVHSLGDFRHDWYTPGVLAGIDPRVKAAVPSCGGAGDVLETQAAFPGGVLVGADDRTAVPAPVA